MRLSSVIAGAVAFLSAANIAADVAYVVRTVIDARIEVRVDATGHTGYIYSRIEPTSPAQFHELAKRACPKNNCQRALNARPELASAFCATYTTTVNPGIGSTFTQCDSNAKLTRACACNYPVSRAHPRLCNTGGNQA